MTTLEPNDRTKLRRFLEERFSLEELAILSFDLGLNPQMLPHATTAQLCMELVAYFERRDNVNCLLTEVLRQRHDHDLARLSAKLPVGSPHPKVQVIIAQDIQADPNEIVADLSAKLKIGVDQVELIGAAWGSLRLLISLPQEASDVLLNSDVRTLVNDRYRVISITAFDSLDTASRKAWQLLAASYASWPPVSWNSLVQPNDDSTPSERLQELIIAKKYRVIEKIERGGQAEVFLALDIALDRKVAVKRSNLLLMEETDRKRFLREAHILANIQHHHIIPIYSLETEDDYLYIVMQYADQGDWLGRIKTNPSGLPVEEIIDVGIAMCQALTVVHERGIFHRDLKPANILLVTEDDPRRPIPKLADFGTAHGLTLSPLTTSTREVMGTFPYMPPEAIKNQEGKADERRDVYGLGAILYQALTGNAPLGNTLPEILNQLYLNREPTPPHEIREDTPAWLEKVIMKALSSNRDERYRSMHEMMADLQNGEATARIVATPSTAHEVPQTKPENTGEVSQIKPERPVQGRLNRLLSFDTQRWRGLIDRTISASLANALPGLMGIMLVLIAAYLGIKSCSTMPPTTPTPMPTPPVVGIATETQTASPAVTVIPSNTPTLSPTLTMIHSATPTLTTTATITPTSTLTATPTPTLTRVPTLTPTPTLTPLPTITPRPDRPEGPSPGELPTPIGCPPNC